MAETKKPGKRTLAALVGAVCAGLLLSNIPVHEGRPARGYIDLAGVPTKCYGDTDDVIVGRYYSDAECKASLEAAIIRIAEPVLRCHPDLVDRPFLLYALIDLGYNNGPRAACDSYIGRAIKDRAYPWACLGFSNPILASYVDPGGARRYPKGLAKRRAHERMFCEADLRPWETLAPERTFR